MAIDMAERRVSWRWLALVIAAVAVASAGPVASKPLGPPPPGWAGWELHPGVHHLLTERPGLVAHAARIATGAPVALRPVVAFDRVGGGHASYDGRQPVSELCRRAGGIVCVNADFFNCRSCGQPAGGVVDRGRPLRSFRPDHEQASIIGGRATFDPLGWVGTLRGAVGRDTFSLDLGSLNRGPLPGGAVVYTPDWGPTTPQVAGQVELVLATGGPHVAGVTHAVPVAIRPNAGPIPRDGVVIAANGRAAERLNWLWHAWHRSKGREQRLTLSTALTAPADLSVGGHPIVLRDGVRQHLDPNDGMVMGRHPRTLLGWTAAGDLLLVTIDGRQPGYSNGATLAEAVDLVQSLGATNAINLDGGGSTTFAIRCATGACVANRPSDGRERPVPLALAVVPLTSGSMLKAASAEPAIVTPPPVPVTTTTVAPSPTTTTTVAAPAPARVAHPTSVALDAPAAQPRPTRTVTGTDPSTSVPAPLVAVAFAGIAGWWLAAIRAVRSSRRR